MVKRSVKHWEQKEDELLKHLIEINESKKWNHISEMMNSDDSANYKSPKQCRDRWVNHLDPKLNQTPWTDEEEAFLIEKHKNFGCKWSIISKFFQGRSANSIKNHFYSLIRKNLRRYNKYHALGKRISGKVSNLIKSPKYYKLLVKPTLPKTHKSFKEVLKNEEECSEAKEVLNEPKNLNLLWTKGFIERNEILSQFQEPVLPCYWLFPLSYHYN
ncbi:hypothetical protein SteCoe_4886 [Stentor coeruleus]|uniref:Myb-like DNA-binding domain containing protein n=1 Tax=Stentor coeruleus TaxID=5963 RepID=A0A1R2CTK6_9CILI|nr:hypothetical protein SteCoe_4886 [Stentor coeruleus]